MMIERQQGAIPEPPDETASPEELAAYYEKYTPQELIAAGHLTRLPKDDPGTLRRQVLARTELAKRKRAQLNIVFTENELSELSEYAKAIHIPVSTIAKSWILRALQVEKNRLSQTGI